MNGPNKLKCFSLTSLSSFASACLPVCLSVCLSACLSVCLSVCLCLYIKISLLAKYPNIKRTILLILIDTFKSIIELNFKFKISFEMHFENQSSNV
jgi:hypothetical protein